MAFCFQWAMLVYMLLSLIYRKVVRVMSLRNVRFLLSDLLYEYEQAFGMLDERTKKIREAYLIVCQEMDRTCEALYPETPQ